MNFIGQHSFLVVLVDGLAWDWVNQKLYWTDYCNHDIEVYDPETQARRVLFVGLSQPHAIVVDPTSGYDNVISVRNTMLLTSASVFNLIFNEYVVILSVICISDLVEKLCKNKGMCYGNS